MRNPMAEPDKRPVTKEELLVSSLAQVDALAKLLIEKGLITREEFMQKISEEPATYKTTLADLRLKIGVFLSDCGASFGVPAIAIFMGVGCDQNRTKSSDKYKLVEYVFAIYCEL
jgi:hypothetical protein